MTTGATMNPINVVELKKLFPPRELLVNRVGRTFRSKAIDDKVVGLVIGPHWLPSPLLQAIEVLVEAYEELKKTNRPLVIVYVALDRDEDIVSSLLGFGLGGQVDHRDSKESFSNIMNVMPDGWLAVPLEDGRRRNDLARKFRSERSVFSLTFVSPDGIVSTKPAWQMLERWGAAAFPFSDERLENLAAEMADIKRHPTLESLLKNVVYLRKSDGTDVPMAELQHKSVGLYFSADWQPSCRSFTTVLVNTYQQLKANNQELEVVFVSSDIDVTAYERNFKLMPWVALPFDDTLTKEHLHKIFEVDDLPRLVILESEGKVPQPDSVALIRKYEAAAYPFTSQKIEELAIEENSRPSNCKLESIRLSTRNVRVVNNARDEIEMSTLLGKSVGFYFSTHLDSTWKGFHNRLMDVYKELTKHGKQFEVIFVPSGRYGENYYTDLQSLPPTWWAMPDSSSEVDVLKAHFEVECIPTLVISCPTGKTITLGGRKLKRLHDWTKCLFTSQRDDPTGATPGYASSYWSEYTWQPPELEAEEDVEEDDGANTHSLDTIDLKHFDAQEEFAFLL